MRDFADRELHEEAIVAEELVLREDLLDGLSGVPTKIAPRSVAAASKSARVKGGQPRSRPMRFIASARGKNSSTAAAVSAM